MAAAKRRASKPKASRPSHVKPLDSVRWSGVRLSSATEKRLKESYTKRRTAARKKNTASKAGAKKSAEPKLSEKTNRKISEAYTARKTRKLRNTRASRWTVEDMRHVAEIGMKFAKSSELPAAERAVIDKVKIEAGRHPGFSRYLYAKYDVYRGPKAFLSVQFPNPDGVTEMGRHVLPGQFYVQAFIRRAGKDETMHEGYHTGAGELDLIAADLLRKLARVAKK